MADQLGNAVTNSDPDTTGPQQPEGKVHPTSGGHAPSVATGLGITTSVAGALLLYGMMERHWYRLLHAHVPDVLTTGSRPLRLLHVSDLHLSRLGRRMTDFVALLAREDYDLLVLTGDLLGDVGMEDDTVSLLAPLTADGRPGVAVLGSNDMYGPSPRNPLAYMWGPSSGSSSSPRLDTQRLVDGLAKEGIETLDNEVRSFATPIGRIVVSGVNDPHLPSFVLPDVADLTSTDDGIVHLGLVHAPYRGALDLLVAAGVDLIMSGHTHGGQVRVPGLGALVTNCDLPTSKARGLSQHDDVWLHVSAGLGTSKYAPIRFACRPEATLLTLLPR